MLQIIFFALLTGVAMSLVGEKAEPVRKIFESANEICMKMVGIIMLSAPIGVFALVAETFSTVGKDAILVLVKYLLVVLLGLSIHVIVVYGGLFKLFTEWGAMMARYDVNNFAVDTILSDIKAGEIAIPEMQRPFVWDASKVRELLDSLYKGFPVGYIIVWQNPKVKLKDGTTSSGKKVLIDGQQRITALSAAIAGNEVLDSHYKWKRIVIAFNPLEETFEVSNSANQKSSKWSISRGYQLDLISKIYYFIR